MLEKHCETRDIALDSYQFHLVKLYPVCYVACKFDCYVVMHALWSTYFKGNYYPFTMKEVTCTYMMRQRKEDIHFCMKTLLD